MIQRKQNISRWYLLGLTVILIAGALLISVGTTLARYRVDQEKNIQFTPRTPAAVALGTMTGEDFTPNGTIAWVKQAVEDGTQTKTVYTLDFAVSNYLVEDEAPGYDDEDLVVRVRMIGTLNAWDPSVGGTVVLKDGVVLDDGSERTFTATVTEIPEDTPLYHAFGVGWIFQFLDADGKEMEWTLKGGELSCVALNITMDASALTDTSLLQLQISGERPE